MYSKQFVATHVGKFEKKKKKRTKPGVGLVPIFMPKDAIHPKKWTSNVSELSSSSYGGKHGYMTIVSLT